MEKRRVVGKKRIHQSSSILKAQFLNFFIFSARKTCSMSDCKTQPFSYSPTWQQTRSTFSCNSGSWGRMDTSPGSRGCESCQVCPQCLSLALPTRQPSNVIPPVGHHSLNPAGRAGLVLVLGRPCVTSGGSEPAVWTPRGRSWWGRAWRAGHFPIFAIGPFGYRPVSHDSRQSQLGAASQPCPPLADDSCEP